MTATPNTEPLSVQERADALGVAALLSASLRVVGIWSVGLSVLAFLVLVIRAPSVQVVMGCWVLVLLLGLMERYMAFRLALDERLFQQLGCGQLENLQSLDTALAHLGLRKQAVADRPFADRLLGTRSLLRQHLALVLVQIAAVLATFLF